MVSSVDQPVPENDLRKQCYMYWCA